MAVPNKVILNKIDTALSEAKKEKDAARMREHIRGVKLLCDLLLDDETDVMEGMQASQQKEIRTYPTLEGSNTIDHEEANGESIFDF